MFDFPDTKSPEFQSLQNEFGENKSILAFIRNGHQTPDLSLAKDLLYNQKPKQDDVKLISESDDSNPDSTFDFSGLEDNNVKAGRATKSSKVTSGYGYRKDPFTGKREFHDGIDIPVPMHTPLKAFGEGIVVFAGTRKGYGKSIGIDYGNGVTIYVNHLSSTKVEPGDGVKPEAIIGYSGSSGRSTGPHVHIQAMRDGKSVDPNTLFTTNSQSGGMDLALRDLTTNSSSIDTNPDNQYNFEELNSKPKPEDDKFDFEGLLDSSTQDTQQVAETPIANVDSDVIKYEAPEKEQAENPFATNLKDSDLAKAAIGWGRLGSFKPQMRVQNPNAPGKPITLNIKTLDGKPPTFKDVLGSLLDRTGLKALQDKYANDKEARKIGLTNPNLLGVGLQGHENFFYPNAKQNPDGSFNVTIEKGIPKGIVDSVNAYARGGANALLTKIQEIQNQSAIYNEDIENQKTAYKQVQQFYENHPYISIIKDLINGRAPIPNIHGMQDAALLELQFAHTIQMLPQAWEISTIHGFDSDEYANLIKQDIKTQSAILEAQASIPEENTILGKVLRGATSSVIGLPRYMMAGQLGAPALPTMVFLENLHRGEKDAILAALPMAVMGGTGHGLEEFMSSGGNPLDFLKKSSIANRDTIASISESAPGNQAYLFAPEQAKFIDFKSVTPFQRQLIMRGTNAAVLAGIDAALSPNRSLQQVASQAIIGFGLPVGRSGELKLGEFRRPSIISGDAYTLADGSVLLHAPIYEPADLIMGRVPREGGVRTYNPIEDLTFKPKGYLPPATTSSDRPIDLSGAYQEGHNVGEVGGNVISPPFRWGERRVAITQEPRVKLPATLQDIEGAKNSGKAMLLDLNTAALNLLDLRKALANNEFLPTNPSSKVFDKAFVEVQRRSDLQKAIDILDKAIPQETQRFYEQHEEQIRAAIKSNYESNMAKEDFIKGRNQLRKSNPTIQDVEEFNPRKTSSTDTLLEKTRRSLVTVEESGRKGLERNKKNKGTFNAGLDPSDIPYLVQIAIGKMGRKGLDAAETIKEMVAEHGEDFLKYGREVIKQANDFIQGVNALSSALTNDFGVATKSSTNIKTPPFPLADLSQVRNVFYVGTKFLSQAKEEDIPLDKVIATQKGVRARDLIKFGEEPYKALIAGRTDLVGNPEVPKAVKINDRYFLFDGHHRSSAAKIKGEESIRGRVIDFNQIANGDTSIRSERAKEAYGETGSKNQYFTQEKQLEVRENLFKPPDANELQEGLTGSAKWFTQQSSNLVQLVGFHVEDAYRRGIEPKIEDIVSKLKDELGDWIDKIDIDKWQDIFGKAKNFYQTNNADPFFSKFKQNVLEKFPNGNVNAKSARNFINGLGTKNEIEWTSGLNGYIDEMDRTGKPVSKQKLLDIIQQGQVKVEESILGEKSKEVQDAENEIVSKKAQINDIINRLQDIAKNEIYTKYKVQVTPSDIYDILDAVIHTTASRENSPNFNPNNNPYIARIMKRTGLTYEQMAEINEANNGEVGNLVTKRQNLDNSLNRLSATIRKSPVNNTRWDLKHYHGDEKLELEGGKNPREVLLRVPVNNIEPPIPLYVRQKQVYSEPEIEVANNEYDQTIQDIRQRLSERTNGDVVYDDIASQEAKEAADKFSKILEDVKNRIEEYNRQQEIEYNKEKEAYENNKANTFTHNHWRGFQNVVAHFRANFRTLVDGVTTAFHGEEFQSDLHQNARTIYGLELADFIENNGGEIELADDRTPKKYGEAERFLKDYTGENKEIANNILNAKGFKQFGESIPNGKRLPNISPFMDNYWKDLVFKRFLRKAVESGVDVVTWTTARQQQERYNKIIQTKDIRTQINNDGTYNLEYKTEYGNYARVPEADAISKEKLRDYIGPELTDKILSQSIVRETIDDYRSKKYAAVRNLDTNGYDIRLRNSRGYIDMSPKALHKFNTKQEALNKLIELDPSATPIYEEGPQYLYASGKDITISKGYSDYDTYFVNLAKKIGKRFGAEYKISEIAIPTGNTNIEVKYDESGIIPIGHNEIPEIRVEKVHSLEITPSMQESLLKEGQPLYGLLEKEPLKPSQPIGIRNRIITTDAFDSAKNEIVKSLSDSKDQHGTVFNSGLNLDAFLDQIKLLYKGWNDFKSFSKDLVNRFGDAISPHLESIWNWVKETANEFNADETGAWAGLNPLARRGLTDTTELDNYYQGKTSTGKKLSYLIHRGIALAESNPQFGEVYNTMGRIRRVANSYGTTIIAQLSKGIQFLQNDTDNIVAQAIFARNEEGVEDATEDFRIIARFGLNTKEEQAYNHIRAAMGNVLELRKAQILYHYHQQIDNINQQLIDKGWPSSGTPINPQHEALLTRLVNISDQITDINNYYDKLKNSGYISLQRLGRYAARAENTTLPIDDPKRFLTDFTDSPEDAQKRIQEWRNTHGATNIANARVADAHSPADFAAVARGLTPAEFEELVAESGINPKSVDVEKLRSEVYEKYPSMGYQLNRKFYEGYQRTNEFMIKSIAHQAEVYQSSYYNNLARNEGLKALEATALDKSDPDLYKISREYIEDDTSHPRYNLLDKAAIKARNTAFYYQMAFSLKQLYLHLIARPIVQNYNYLARVENPLTGDRLGGVKEVEQFFINGTRLATKIGREGLGLTVKHDTIYDEFLDTYNRLKQEEVVTPQFTKSLLQLDAEKPVGIDNKYKSLTRRFFSMKQQEHWASSFLRAGDTGSRTQMAASMFLIGKKFGLSGEALHDFIVRGVEATNGNYSRGENPNLIRKAGEVGKLFYQFSVFRHSWLENLAMNVKSDWKHRSIAATSRTLGPMLITSGIRGLPLSGFAFALYALSTGRNPVKDAKKEVGKLLGDSEYLENAVLNGWTGRIGLSHGVKFPILDNAAAALTQDSYFDKLLSSDIPAVATTKQIASGLSDIAKGVYKWHDTGKLTEKKKSIIIKGGEELLPQFARQGLRGYRIAKEGYTTTKGKSIIKPMLTAQQIANLVKEGKTKEEIEAIAKKRVTTTDITLQSALGVTPNKVTEKYETDKYKKIRKSKLGKATKKLIRKVL